MEIDLLLSFKEQCLVEHYADTNNRKIVRPLIEAIDKAERTFNVRKSRK